MSTAAEKPPAPVPPDQVARERALTGEVLASFDTSGSPRYREIMNSLVRHLHAFARDVRLTQEEWAAGIDFLTRTGQLSDDKRQEFILLSDVLGLSMLTVGINAPAAPEATESTVLGPFFVAGAPEIPLGGNIAQGARGTPCYVAGTVRSVAGTPLAGVRIDVWEADDTGRYDVQYDGDRTVGRGWLRTAENGEYRFWSTLPAPYPIPDDGPVGELLAAAGRGPTRPAHLHFKVEAPGYRTLITHVFVAGDPYLECDAVFGVKDSLVVDVGHEPPGRAPDGTERRMPWARVTFDIVLAPQQEARP